MNIRITRLILVPLLATGFILAGCSGCGAVKNGSSTSTPAPLRPGAISTFDQDTYDTLVVIQATLNAAKPIVAAKYPNLKDALNKAGASYTTAAAAWKLYHSQAGTDPAKAAALAQQVADLKRTVADLQTSIGGKV